MSKLYYTAPPDENFEDMRNACLEVWQQYKDSPGGYMEEKVSRISDIKNVQDNFMYMLAMFDMDNQRKVIAKLNAITKELVKARLIDGGNTPGYLQALGFSVGQEPIRDENSEVTRMTLLNIQVCSKLPIEGALDWVRRVCPAGTSNNWGIDDRKEAAPVACADDSTRTHYVFTC